MKSMSINKANKNKLGPMSPCLTSFKTAKGSVLTPFHKILQYYYARQHAIARIYAVARPSVCRLSVCQTVVS